MKKYKKCGMNIGVNIMFRLFLDVVCLLILFVIAYYALWIGCLIEPSCFERNFVELI